MGTTLTGKRVQNTYDSLLKLSDNDNLTGTAKIVGDGLGNDSPIYLSTTQIGIGVTPSFQFHTSGNAKIGGNLTISGDLTVNGTTTIVDSTVVAIGDNMMEMAKDNVANTMDIGWYGTINSSGEKYVGVFYDASTGVTTPEFHIGLGTTEPSSTASWTTKGKLVIGALDATTGVFSGQVTIPETPVANTDAASKGYVDSQITAQDLDIAGDSGTGAVDLDSQTFTISGGTNVTTSVSGQTVTINASGGIDGSGTANDVVMWQDSDTLTDAPIAISGNNATFAGNISVADSVTVTGSGYGSLELGGPSGGYIDLKAPASDDYDIRIITSSGGNEITTASGDLKINTGNTLTLTLDGSTQSATFAGKLILPSSHTKQKIEVYGGGSEWIGTSTATLELSGGSINLNGASGTGASTLKNAGTTIIDTSSNVYAYSFRPVGSTNGLEIYGYGGTNMVIQGVAGATYYRASGSSTLCSTHQAGYIILATGLAYGAVNNYTEIINGSTGAISGTSATFSGDVTPTTDSTSDLGSTSIRWANVWTDNINGGTPVNTANDLVFDRASTRKIIFNSDTNFGSDKAFLYFNENSSFHRTGTENVRFSIGTFNDFSNSTAHSDAVDVQGGARLYLNAGDWDTELDSAIGTPGTGAYLDSYPIQFAVNNDQKIRIGSGGDLNVKSATYSNYLNIGTYLSNHINSSTLPDAPSEHMINIAPPSDTNYYGGGISWSEGTNTAASLGVFDDGATGALGFYVATGNNSGLTKAFEIDSTQNTELYGPLRITTSNLDGVIEGYDSNHSIVLRENNTNSTSYYQYGGTLAQGRGHKFYTGGLKASQSLRFHIADDGIESSLSVLPSADSSYDLGSTSKYWRNLYVDNIYSDGGNSNALKVYRGTATISNTAYTTIATVNGDNLASAIRLAVTGTSGNVVINCVAEILVNHSTDILIKAQNGFYTRLKIKIVSDNNEDFAIELQRVDTTGNTTVAFEITPLGNEAITLTSSHSISGSTLEHVCERGESRSSNDTAGYKYDSRFEDGAKIRLGDGSDLELYHDGTKSVIADVGIGALRIAGTNFELRNADQSKFYMNATDGGAINLYYDNSKKLETTSNGAVVSDYLGVKDVVAVGDNDYNGGMFARVSNTSYDGNWGFNIQRTSGVDDYNVRMQFYPASGTTRKLGLYDARSNDWILYADGSVNSNCDVKIPNGNLLIGSTGTPSYKLQVNGTAYINETLYVNGNTTVDANLDVTSGGRVKVSGSNTDQYYFEGQRNGVGVTYRLYDNSNNVYHDSWTSQIFRLNQIGGSGGYLSIYGGGVGINMAAISDGGQLYINNGQTALNQGHPATSGSTQNAITRVFAGYGTYGEVLDTGFNVSSSPYAWIQATNHTALNVNYNLILNPNGGNIGIGTGQTAPSHSLHIKKPSSGDAALMLETVTGGDPTIYFNSAAANRSGLIKFQDNGTNIGRIEYVHNGDRIAFQAGSATGETMSIVNGAVGIGLTTGINQKLTVQGNISVPNANSIYFAGPNDANWRIGRNIHTYNNQIVTGNSMDIMAHHSSNQGFTVGPNISGTNASLEIKHGTGVAHHILLTGDVGINEANTLSNRKFRSNGGYSLEGGGYNTSYTSDGLFGATATPNILSFASGRRVLLGYSDNGSGLYAETMAIETHSTDGLGNTVEKNGFLIKNINSGSWVFQVTNLGQVTCDSRVRIATTRTDEILNINGNIKGVNSAGYTHFFHNDPYHGMTLRGYPTSATSTSMTAADVMSFMEYGGDFRFYKKNTSVLTLQGRLSNGTWTVTDDIVAFGSPSDIRLKENIKPIESALDKVNKLKGVTFDWKENKDDLTNIKHDYGFIAQDVEKVIPELVRTKKDGMKSLRYQGITPILLEAIKELKAEIQELKSEIKELKK